MTKSKKTIATRWARGGLTLIILALLAACGGRDAGWTTTHEVYEQPQAPAAPHAGMPPMASGAMAPASGANLPPAADMALQWKTPEGWSETAGTGMRLVTFSMKQASGEGTCTVIVLGGAAGGLEANVARWVGQVGMKAPVDADMKAFIAKQEKFKTAGGFEAVAVDLGDLAPTAAPDSASMLGAIVDVDGATCFVKLTGPAGLLKGEKARFLALCQSLDRKS